MKSPTLITLAALASAGFALGQATTTPVGYTTQTLSPNKYTLVSVTTHNSTIASGVLDAASAAPNTVTDNQVNFTTSLTAGSVYILELPNGLIQEISNWSGSVLTTPNNITASVVAGTTTYNLRKASTVSDIFGANNKFGLLADGDENINNNDLILIPNASNAFDTVYYYDDGSTVGWYDLQGNPAGNKVINYADGIFVQRRNQGTNIDMVITGEVKTKPTSSALFSGYNYMGAVAPVGLTLANSGLQNSLTIATNETQANTIADYVLQQQPNGTYRTAYYYNDGSTVGWYDLAGNPADDMVLNTGYLIRNKGVPKNVSVSVPSSYATP